MSGRGILEPLAAVEGLAAGMADYGNRANWVKRCKDGR